ncbi:MAG: YihY/virulence factor BrkB family protein [Actinomycetota bacterium]|nr:YihY/virulence factor BrkB family protein [Actinomycetota bacterium]
MGERDSNGRHNSTSRAGEAGGSPPGVEAERQTEIPAKGWREVLQRGWKEAQSDQVPLLAGGVAFFGFLALFPGIIATVLIYGLVVDPATVREQITELGGALPAEARQILTDQLESLTSTSSSTLGIGVVISVALALWSASGGIGYLITAINTAYDEDEGRGFVKRKLLALGLTLATIVFLVVVIALVAVAPALFDSLVGSGPFRWLLEAIRWAVLLVLLMAAMAVLYRTSPDRDAPKMRWVSVGAAIATVLWIIASLGFSLYVDNFGSYGKTYGALAGVVVLMLWLWISAYAVLLGAEINAESEQQTIRDSTKGPRQPLGERGAVKADSVPEGTPAGKRQAERSGSPR